MAHEVRQMSGSLVWCGPELDDGSTIDQGTSTVFSTSWLVVTPVGDRHLTLVVSG